MISLRSLFVSIILALSPLTLASAAELSLHSDKAEVVNGESFTIQIGVDDAMDLTACSFTLIYPQVLVEIIDPGVSSEFFQPIQVGPFSQLKTWRQNLIEAGQIKLAGAYIDTDSVAGGGGNYTGQQVLFNIYFKVKADATVSVIDITLQQTMLCSELSGWGIDQNQNGQYDEEDSDQYESMPLLIKAFPKPTSEWETAELGDDFEVLLASFSVNPTLSINIVLDLDGDMVPDYKDDFPDDPDEWEDTDSDGEGNNADSDDDNDGMPDEWEKTYELNSLLSNAFEDEDNDGFCNLREYLSLSNPVNEFDIPNCIADATSDSDIDGIDILMMIQHLDQTTELEQREEFGFDFNNDGKIDYIDVFIFSEDFGRLNCQ